jgi:hypothetical protein
MFGEGVLRSGRDKEDRPRGDRIAFPVDTLGAFPSKVEEQLAVRMPVGAFRVEGLEVTVHPQFPDRPVTATQAELPEEDRANGSSH